MIFSNEGSIAEKYSRDTIRATEEHVESILKWITDRDIAILKELLKEPFMTTSQIEMMFFNDLKVSAWRDITNKRLRRLYKEGCIDRFFPRLGLGVGSSEAHYYIDYAGARALGRKLGYTTKQFKFRKRSYLPDQYKHYSKILDFKALLHVLNRQLGFTDEGTVGEIIHWNTQKRYDYHFTLDNKVQKSSLFPDAFCIYKYTAKGGLKFFFLECDNATEPIETLKMKLNNYRRFHASGEWRKEKWARALNVFPVILFVFHQQDTVDEMVDYSRRLDSSLKLLFTTYDQLIEDTYKEYRNNLGKRRLVLQDRQVKILEPIWSSKDGLVSF